MKKATATLVSASFYSQSRMHEAPKEHDKESHDAYAKRTWREHAHINKNGNVYIPCTALKNCISEAAAFLGMQIQGKGKSTYKKHFEAGVLVEKDAELPVKKDDLIMERLFLPSDGIRGSGKRVWKYYPYIPEWKAVAEFIIADETITEEVMKQHLVAAGQFIGIGRFRPRQNGYYGRFSVQSFKWEDFNI